jgi:uncharacterized protein YhaN
MHPDGGDLIPGEDRDRYDLERLERAVQALLDAHGRISQENAAMRRKVEEQAKAIRSLEGRVLEANQKRQDVAKRIDELIAQVTHLEDQLGSAEPL